MSIIEVIGAIAQVCSILLTVTGMGRAAYRALASDTRNEKLDISLIPETVSVANSGVLLPKTVAVSPKRKLPLPNPDLNETIER